MIKFSQEAHGNENLVLVEMSEELCELQRLNHIYISVSFVNLADSVWTSATDVAQEGNWIWLGSNTPVNITWAAGEPNGMINENCAIISATLGFVDVTCENQAGLNQHVLCEIV